MLDGLKIVGASTSLLTSLEKKTRYFHLSESKIRGEIDVILKVLLLPNVVDKLKVCISMFSFIKQLDSLLSSPDSMISLLLFVFPFSSFRFPVFFLSVVNLLQASVSTVFRRKSFSVRSFFSMSFWTM